MSRTISHHMLRRTARAKEARLERALAEKGMPGNHYKVESSMRGPFGWRVVRL